MTMNKGNLAFSSEQEEIKHFLEVYKPDVLFITEANMKIDNNNIKVEFRNYNIKKQIMYHVEVSLVCMLLRKGIR